jgi:hypothetical protein
MNLPRIERNHSGYSLVVDGKPTLLLGGQIHNSSSSSTTHIDRSFAKAKALNFNFVISPVSWKQFERVEGEFDVTLIDHQIRTAESLGLKLALIWFGAFKNARSTYAPRWVREYPDRFPRALVEPQGQVHSTPTLSVFSDNLLQADKRALCHLMEHLHATDSSHTVVMLQIENEMGLLGASRDYCGLAEAEWLKENATDEWQSHERFMAKRFAHYANELARAAKEIKPLPMFVNAWLGPQSGQSEAGQWPSGGPSSLVLDVWKEHAPDIDILSPDIYVLDAPPVMSTYARDDNPLFIPESRHSVGNMLWAIGHHKAIGYSVFGAEDGRLGNQMSVAYAILNECRDVLTKAQADNRIRGILLGDTTADVPITFGNLEVQPSDNMAQIRRFVETAGVDLVISEDQTQSELEDLKITIPSPADGRPSGILVQSADDEFLLIGRGLNLSFSEPGFRVEIDEVEEGRFEANRWVPMRDLNGDERFNFVPVDHIGCCKIRILKFPV